MKPSALLSWALALPLASGVALAQDPTKQEVPLPALGGWNGSLVIDNGPTGIWTVGAFPIFEQYAVPEVVGLDDEGRCYVLVSYSGKWTPIERVNDGAWLGGLAHGDVDPRVEGAELYTGGKKGNLYQLRPYTHGALDAQLIAYLPGREVHTILAGELDPTSPGEELIVFTRPGGLYRSKPTGPDGRFVTEFLGDLPGRVRDALVLPAANGRPARMITASREGSLNVLSITPEGPRFDVVHRGPMGMGRVTASTALGRDPVVYVALDDGRVLRCEEGRGGWRTETIYAGPQGLRGIVAGRFHEDPGVETLAVFGYSRKVQLLSRASGGPWEAETIFVDRDKGHWLAAADVDGRNGTDELLCSGYGGRIVLLSRPPGYGLEGVTTDPDAEEEPATTAPADAPRVGVRASHVPGRHLSPLSYKGGFQVKSLIYETLVHRDAEGRIAPGLATRWEILDGGRAFRFELRPDARFHDGTPVDAESVRLHFRRWTDLPEHAWLGASERIRDVVVESERTFRIVLDRPYALLSDLCAINPCAIQGPGALDREGEFVRPVGSGPFELVTDGAPASGYRLKRIAGEGLLEIAGFESGDKRRSIDALLDGSVDLVFDGWYGAVPRDRLPDLRARDDLEVFTGPGSSVWYLSFRLDGPTANRDVRRAVAAAVDRVELIAKAEKGLADPATSWAAPTVLPWPAGRLPPEPRGPVEGAVRAGESLTLLVHESTERELALARVLVEQLARRGLAARVFAVDDDAYGLHIESGAYDLRIERTWGVPYDPLVSLRSRFLPPPDRPSAANVPRCGIDPRVTRLVRSASRIPSEEDRLGLYGEIQDLLDEEQLIVPLLVPRRVGVRRVARIDAVRLGHDIYRTALDELSRR